MKKQTFLHGSLILIASAAAAKVIGAIFRIPLANMLGGSGMGYFSAAYGIFMTVYAFSVTGLPIAAAKLTAESACAGYGQLKRIKNTSVIFYSAIGLFFSLAMILLAVPFCKLTSVGNEAVPAVMLIAPSVLFSCAASAYRGCSEGMHNMYPTALSQVIEAAVKLASGIFLCGGVIWLYRHSPDKFALLSERAAKLFPSLRDMPAAELVVPLSAAAAVCGVTLSTLAGLIFIVLYTSEKRGSAAAGDQQRVEIISRLTAVIIPAAIGSLITNLTSLIDLTTITGSLKQAVRLSPQSFSAVISSGISAEALPNFIFGSFTGLAVTIFNLIPSFTNMLGKSVIPGIAEAYASNDAERMKQSVMNVIFTSAFIAVPAGIGISVLSGDILGLLFPARSVETALCIAPLRILGMSVAFLAVSSVIFSVLQAAGKGSVPVKIMLAGVAVKLVGNLVLVRIPSLNVSGAAISTLLCYGLICVLSFCAAAKYTGISVSKVYILFIKLTVCGFLCAISAQMAQNLMYNFTCNRLILFPAVIFGVLIYIISTYLLGVLSKSTLKLLIC